MRAAIAVVALASAVLATLIGPMTATVFVTTAERRARMSPTAAASGDIPPEMLSLYRQAAAARCPGLPWPVLAAVGKVETDHGRNVGVSTAGALGPMQFLPATWAAYGVDATGDGVADVRDRVDAVHGAATYLCANGGGDAATLRDALFAYNRAHWYVDLVLEHAADYGELGTSVAPAAAELVAHPNVILTGRARRDLEAGMVDQRVVTVLSMLAERHQLAVSVFRSGHTKYIAGTSRVSLHWCAQAADVWQIDGRAVSRSHGGARAVAEWLRQLEGPLRPTEVGSPFADLRGAGFFTDANHQGHLHIGYEPRCADR